MSPEESLFLEVLTIPLSLWTNCPKTLKDILGPGNGART